MSIDNYQVTKLKNSVHLKTMSQENLCPVQPENNEDDDLTTETISASVNVRSRELMDNATSNMSSLMNFLKGNIGTGILAMPYAFAQAGLWLGFVGILILGAIATHCMHVLVNCSHKLCERTSSVALDYPDVVECALRTGPQRLRSTATIFRRVIYVFITFTQFGFCCVYIVFVAQNLKQPIDHFYSNTKVNVKVYIAIISALLIPYCFISNLKTLSIFSLLANLLTVCGLVITFQYIVQKLPPIDSVVAFKPLSNLPSFFGTAVYSFEGISLVLPIENKMRTPQDFGGWTGILTLGMVIVVCLYTSIGFYGFLKFDSDVKGSITLNLPNEWLYIMVKLLLAIAIFISFAIQFYVPLNLLKPAIGRIESLRTQKIVNFLIRTGLIILLCILALFVPYLELLISLIGAFASSGLALIFPPLIEIVTYSAEGENLSWIVLMKDICIILIGVLGFLTGTYTSIVDIIHKVIT